MKGYVTACLLACGIFVAAAVLIPLSASAADIIAPPRTEEATWYGAIMDLPSHEAPSVLDHMLPVQEEPACEEPVYEEYYVDYGGYDPDLNNNPAYSGAYRGNPDGLNSFNGVYGYNGHLETYYANRAVYDDQLWVDDDGFFRDDQGRYVVASSDYEHGTEIEISQGTAVVMDDGPESGTVDVHTTWGR